jgi:hypothetical protein
MASNHPILYANCRTFWTEKYRYRMMKKKNPPERKSSTPIRVKGFVYADLGATLHCSWTSIVEELKDNPKFREKTFSS